MTSSDWLFTKSGRFLVIGLLAHSLLIQTINDLFVGDKHPTAKQNAELSDLLKVLTPQVKF